MPFLIPSKSNHKMSLDQHLAHQQQHRPQSLLHTNASHHSYDASQVHLHPHPHALVSRITSPYYAASRASTSTSTPTPPLSSSSSTPTVPSSLSLTANSNMHWSHASNTSNLSNPHHTQSNGTAGQRPYDSGEHETSASSYSAAWGQHPPQSQQSSHPSHPSHPSQSRHQWTFDDTYSTTDVFPPSSSQSSQTQPYYSSSPSSSSLTNAVGSFSYSSLSGTSTMSSVPSSLSSSTLPSASSTPLSSHKLEPASWSTHSHSNQQPPGFYPLNITSQIDLSLDLDESMSPLTPISPSIPTSPPSRSSLKDLRIKQEDSEVEHTDGFVFEMPGPSPSHSHQHPFTSSSSIFSSRDVSSKGRNRGISGPGAGPGPVVSQFSPMSVVPLRATQASADMKKMMGAFRLDPFTMQNGLGERTSRKKSNAGGVDGKDAKEGNGNAKGKRRKNSKASLLSMDFEDELELADEEDGLGKNWLGEDIGPLIGDTMLVEFEVGLIEPLLDPSIYPIQPAILPNNWYQDPTAEDAQMQDSTYGNERGRRGLGPSESNMMPFLSVVALSPRDYSLASAHQALVARHLVAGEPAPKPLANLSIGGDEHDARMDQDEDEMPYSYSYDYDSRQSKSSAVPPSQPYNMYPSPELGFSLPTNATSSRVNSTSNTTTMSQTSAAPFFSSLDTVYQNAHASSASLKGYGFDSLSGSYHPHSTSSASTHHSQNQPSHYPRHQDLRTISLDSDADNTSTSATSTLMTPAQSLQWSLQTRGNGIMSAVESGTPNDMDYGNESSIGMSLSRRPRAYTIADTSSSTFPASSSTNTQIRTPSPVHNPQSKSLTSSPHHDVKSRPKSLVDHIRQSTFHPPKRTSLPDILESSRRTEDPTKSARYHPYGRDHAGNASLSGTGRFRTDSASSHRSRSSTTSSSSSCASPDLLTPTSTATTVPANLASSTLAHAFDQSSSYMSQLPSLQTLPSHVSMLPLPSSSGYKRQASNADVLSYSENLNIDPLGLHPYPLSLPSMTGDSSLNAWYGTVVGR